MLHVTAGGRKWAAESEFRSIPARRIAAPALATTISPDLPLI
jgi:hypothetical protein